MSKHLKATANTAEQTPVTFRLPRVGTRDPYFGCARSFWNERILKTAGNGNKPPIKTIEVKQRGKKRGIRLIVFASAKAYFDALVQSQDSVQTEEAGA